MGGVPDNSGKIQPLGSPTGGEQRNEQDKSISALIDTMARSGKTADQINEVIAPLGWKPVTKEQVEGAQAFLRKNPSFTGTLGEATNTVDQSMLNRAAGSPGGAFGVGLANGATAGFLDEGVGAINSALTGQPMSQAIAEADAKKQASASANPGMSLLGNIGGGVTSTALGGLAAARLGLTQLLGKAAPLAGDVAYGALSGAGEMNDSRGLGAAIGAGGGIFGNMIGDRLTSGAGKVATGVRDPDVRYLSDQGIDLSGGQMLGGAFKTLEDRLTGTPGIGGGVEGVRDTAERQLNLAGFNQANKAAFNPAGGAPYQPVTEIGGAGVQQLDAATGRAYDDALSGVSLSRDPTLDAEMTAARARGATLPADMAGNADFTLGRVDTGFRNGQMSGNDFQQAARGIRTDAGKSAHLPYGHDFSDVAGQGIDALEGLLQRQSPGALEGYTRANTGNRMHMILADAVDKAQRNDGQWSPMNLLTAQRTNTNKYLGKVASASGDGPFHQLATAAQRVMPSTTGSSGTAERAAVMASPAALGSGVGYLTSDSDSNLGVLGDTAGVSGLTTAGALLAGSALNTKAGRAALARLLMKRPDYMVQGGQRLINAAPVGGLFGRAVGANTALALAPR